MRITLAIVTNRQVQAQTLESLLKLVSYTAHDIHVVVATRGYNIAENRNYCVIQAQKNESDYLLFVDDDMTFGEDTLERLLARDVDIIGVNSYSRCLPLTSTVGLMDEKGEYKHPERYPEWEMKIPDDLFEAYFVGCGVCLIKMEVFDKLQKPWFQFIMGKDGQIIHGEDGYFCAEARKQGYKIYCDPKIEVGHIGTYNYQKIS